MEMKLKTTKIILFLLITTVLLILLYHIPIENNSYLNHLCLYKNLFGIECFNCGMTRACLSTLHFDFKAAFAYNSNVTFVFPLLVIVYLYSWYRYINKKEEHNKK